MFPLSEGLEVVASRVCELRDLPEHALGGMGLEPRIRPRIDVQPRASQSLSVSVRISDHCHIVHAAGGYDGCASEATSGAFVRIQNDGHRMWCRVSKPPPHGQSWGPGIMN